MEAEPLICPRCGADLDVPDGVEIFRCQYCGSKCQVKTSGSVRGLALLEAGMQKVVQHTERSADGIEQLVASAQSQELARKKAHANWQSKLAELESRRRSANSAAATCLFLGFTIPVASCASFGFFIKSQGGGAVRPRHVWLRRFDFPPAICQSFQSKGEAFRAGCQQLEQPRAVVVPLSANICVICG